jgi:aryl-alcohol dehydrogenase-like predicted oxidoreductase
VPDPTHTAIGTWSGGRFMHFGEPLDDERLIALLRPDDRIRTVLTADAYGAGEADRLLGRALSGTSREAYCLVGAIGHDFYAGERQGAKGYPRFTDPALRAPDGYADYVRMAAERSLERIGADRFDLLLLHNPDRIGYTSEAVWRGLQDVRDAGLTRLLGVAPGPANGFTLDLIDCFERFGALIDWAMIILNPLEPWPGELALPAARAHDVRLITRVVDYGGLFHDDVLPGHSFPRHDHRSFRPAGWVEAGRERLERMRPIADRHGLTPLQLACAWNLAHEPVACVAPTLIQEAGAGAKPIEAKRAELAGVPASGVPQADTDGEAVVEWPPEAGPQVVSPLGEAEIDEIRTIGDNTGSMALKGASPDHEGAARPDRWELDGRLAELAARWAIEPDRDLRQAPALA